MIYISLILASVLRSLWASSLATQGGDERREYAQMKTEILDLCTITFDYSERLLKAGTQMTPSYLIKSPPSLLRQ